MPFFCRHLGTVNGVKEGNPTSASGAVPFVVAKLGADWQITDSTRMMDFHPQVLLPKPTPS
jgi:hypothetical protein